MPPVEVVFYCETDGSVPVLEWLEQLRARDRRAFAKCVVKTNRLSELGHQIRRPEADFLGHGVYELRARSGTINYRVLYFFHGREVYVLAHALTKEDQVPRRDIETALMRKARFEEDTEGHTHRE